MCRVSDKLVSTGEVSPTTKRIVLELLCSTAVSGLVANI